MVSRSIKAECGASEPLRFQVLLSFETNGSEGLRALDPGRIQFGLQTLRMAVLDERLQMGMKQRLAAGKQDFSTSKLDRLTNHLAHVRQRHKRSQPKLSSCRTVNAPQWAAVGDLNLKFSQTHNSRSLQTCVIIRHHVSFVKGPFDVSTQLLFARCSLLSLNFPRNVCESYVLSFQSVCEPIPSLGKTTDTMGDEWTMVCLSSIICYFASSRSQNKDQRNLPKKKPKI